MDNEMAFPNVVTDADGNNVDYQKGLTKREYFAAMAMQGILANHIMVDQKDEQSLDWVSDASVKYADALIKQLNSNNNG